VITVDPFESVKPGEPDPTPDDGDFCEDVREGYTCTRDPGHEGQHIAGTEYGFVIATWKDGGDFAESPSHA
jgi:hypothetical protein